MAALPADILRASRAGKVVIWDSGRDTGRDGLKAIEPGFFENAADAQAVLKIKADLIATRRRLFTAEVQGEIPVDPLGKIPMIRLIDAEIDADVGAVLTRYEYDMQTEMTQVEVLG